MSLNPFKRLAASAEDLVENPPDFLNLVFSHAPLPDTVEAEICHRMDGDIATFQLAAETAPLEEQLALLLQGDARLLRVLLHGVREDERLPLRLLRILAARSVRAVLRIEAGDGWIALHDHRPLQDVQARMLMVFPGMIVPVIMGSHRRAFELLATLNEQNCPVDVLISGSDRRLADSIPLLHQIVPRVETFNNCRPRLEPRLRWRKRFERCMRIFGGKFRPPPDLFEERLNVAVPHSGRTILRRLIESSHYRAVILNYAWLSSIRSLISSSESAGIAWICDSHDVQFVRNATDNQNERRYFRSATRERQCEVDVLNSFDLVLAISEPDAEVLEKELQPGKVLFTPTGFDYASGEPRLPDPQAPVFGFIGRLMRANDKALEVILIDWWPHLRRRWPQARLRLAGSICEAKRLDPENLPPGVILDAFVPDLCTWYRSLDVVLNPVAVQGGMNYKSMEALMAAKLLVTNRLGSTCLGDACFATLAESGEEAVSAVEQAMADPTAFLAARREIRERAKATFGNASASRGLVEFLRDLARPAPPAACASTPQTVLIQCGDHLENRLRISALAQGLRERGHHPVALVYKREFVAPFLALGVDAVALADFEQGPVSSGRIRSIYQDYRGFDVSDVAGTRQLQQPESFSGQERSKTLRQIARYIDRCIAMLEHVRPDQLIIWNGHTGWVANILRHHARRQGLPRFFLERSIFQDGVFIDPSGTNGSARLARMDAAEVDAAVCPPARRPMTPLGPDETCRLREAGPWRGARRIIFIPLQVEADTNILLYSPHFKTMDAFVGAVYQTYRGEGVAFIVRPHPEEVATNLQLPLHPEIYIDSSSSLAAWIEAADLTVTINSTVGLEALLRHKPVRAFGHGLYTGKGLTRGETAPPARLEKFWDLLVSRHTSLPEQPVPQCVAESLPPVPPQPVMPRNPWRADPAECRERAMRFQSGLRAAALADGELVINTGATGGMLLDLNYRATKIPFNVDGLAARLHQLLELPPGIDIRCVTDDTPAAAVVLSADLPPSDLPGIDCYGWILVPVLS